MRRMTFSSSGRCPAMVPVRRAIVSGAEVPAASILLVEPAEKLRDEGGNDRFPLAERRDAELDDFRRSRGPPGSAERVARSRSTLVPRSRASPA